MDTVNDVPKPWNPLGLRKILGRYRAVRAGRDALNVLRVGGKRLRQGNATEKPDLVRWQRILNRQGWAAYSWPREWGGPGWSAVQRMIFL